MDSKTIKIESKNKMETIALRKQSCPAGLTKSTLLKLYKQMLLLRRFEETAEKMIKKGTMPGFAHLYIGEEAVGVGVCENLRKDDWVVSTHRGHGHALAKGIGPSILMAELMGKSTGCSGGRGGTMHIYDRSTGFYGTNGIVAGGIPLAVGLGLSAKTRGTDQVAVSFFGDGAVNHGAFHEALNFAGIQGLPVVFICENNLYATSTHIRQATKNTDIASKAAAYGIESVSVDGNDVIAVWKTIRQAVEKARKGGGPVLVEAQTYRLNGHYVGEPIYGSYRTKEEFEQWKEKCPIKHLRQLLVKTWKLADEKELDIIDQSIEMVINEAVEFALKSPDPSNDSACEHIWAEPINPDLPYLDESKSLETVKKGWLEAVTEAIAEEMKRDSNIIYLGEGTAQRGGCFGQSKGLWNAFGDRQNVDTPISELGFTGAAIAASATGCRSIADLMFTDLMFEAASQIINQAAKLHYMSNGQFTAPVVIRAPMGNCNQTGAHHSGAYYPVWAHVPGLIVVVPSSPIDAKGLMKTALRSQNPVIFLEQKGLFGLKCDVPVEEYYLPFGKAKVVKKGSDLTIVSCGLLMHKSLEVAHQLEQEGLSCEVIDLRTIVPLDTVTLVESVRKTGRLLVVDEAYSMCGIGAEVSAVMTELAFNDLKAPVGRVHTEPVAHPFSPALDKCIIVTNEKILTACRQLMEGKVPCQTRPNI